MGLAARGRMLAVGYNTCILMMNRRKIKILILAGDLADNSKEKMISNAKKNNVPFRIYRSMENLSHITGKENSGIFGITDENLSKAILEEIDHIQSM